MSEETEREETRDWIRQRKKNKKKGKTIVTDSWIIISTPYSQEDMRYYWVVFTITLPIALGQLLKDLSSAVWISLVGSFEIPGRMLGIDLNCFAMTILSFQSDKIHHVDKILDGRVLAITYLILWFDCVIFPDVFDYQEFMTMIMCNFLFWFPTDLTHT